MLLYVQLEEGPLEPVPLLGQILTWERMSWGDTSLGSGFPDFRSRKRVSAWTGTQKNMGNRNRDPLVHFLGLYFIKLSAEKSCL